MIPRTLSSKALKTTVFALAASVLLGTAAQAGNVWLDIVGIQSTASAGDAAVGSHNRAVAEILAHDMAGNPVANLAGPGWTGDEAGPISIKGWRIRTLDVGAAGCDLKPIALQNIGDGTYSLMLGTASTSGPCDWKRGDYVFSLSIKAGGHSGIGLGHIPIR
ncbi:MAG: hypothetical protein QNJ16_11280 [Rhodobacter sp.]|nr:hypothetical protein [Rhodobacter sp.]